MQFDKSFVEPLKNIVQLINWNVELSVASRYFLCINNSMAYSKKVVDRFESVLNNQAHSVGKI